MADIVRRRRRRNLRLNRIFRDRTHPFEVFDDGEVYCKFRLTRDEIRRIADEVHDDLVLANRQGSLTPILQVLLCLRYYASGSFQDLCGELIGVTQSTTSKTVTRVTNALLRHVPNWIIFPNQREADLQKAKFAGDQNGGRGFPDVVGCIDGTQIRIQAPPDNEHEYVNRKNYHSINVQVVCNADMVFTDVVARWPGSVHDARILRQSTLFAAFEADPPPVNGVLLGDSGYMLRHWLMTPFANPRTAAEERYNATHASTRATIERTIGCAKRRWHCLQGLRVTPGKACSITTVCMMLHNRARRLRLPDDNCLEFAENADEPFEGPDYHDNAGGQDNRRVQERLRLERGRRARDRVVLNHFTR